LPIGWSTASFRCQAARGGTLFLDEVGELPLELQAKLLNVLTEQRFEQLATGDAAEVDARIIVATRRTLEADVRDGRFREDLYFRLNVVTITLPPLRERDEDLAVLTDHVVARLAIRHGRGVLSVSPAVRRIFAAYRWPGNAHELVNVLERAIVLAPGDTIMPEHLPSRLLDSHAGSADGAPSTLASLKELERRQIERVIADSRTLEEAAVRLGINAATLWRKRRRYGLG
jgi:NtrC-family two-component system response regulator AlgB